MDTEDLVDSTMELEAVVAPWIITTRRGWMNTNERIADCGIDGCAARGGLIACGRVCC